MCTSGRTPYWKRAAKPDEEIHHHQDYSVHTSLWSTDTTEYTSTKDLFTEKSFQRNRNLSLSEHDIH